MMKSSFEDSLNFVRRSQENAIEILVVDDSRVQAKVLKNLLSSNAYEVRVASNGAEAMRMTQEKRPDLVVSDVVMPIMDGYEFCRALKQDELLKSIPVILLTSLSDIEDIVLGLNANADYYLTKPYSPSYLLSTIENVLHSVGEPIQDDGESIVLHVGEASHVVTAGRRQMLNLLLSTYGNAVEHNRALTQAQHDLKMLNEQLREQAVRIEEQQGELQAANSRLQSLATQDSLTGLKNRHAFREKLDDELHRAARYSQQLSLVLMDVDAFKQYNDTYGHPGGDIVLQTLARLLEGQSRATDFVARYGGEEFAVLLPNTDRHWAMSLAERLRDCIEKAPWPQRAVTASFGIATFQASEVHARDAANLIEAADQALYHSKRSGRNRVSHSEEINS